MTFNIGMTDEKTGREDKVVRFTLGSRHYRPGDLVRGHFDFSSATRQCYRVAASLDLEERLEDGTVTKSKSQAWFHQYCLHAVSTHLQLALPHWAPPCFSAATVTVTWYLRVRLVVQSLAPADGRASGAPAVDCLNWQVPLLVQPTTVITGGAGAPPLTWKAVSIPAMGGEHQQLLKDRS